MKYYATYNTYKKTLTKLIGALVFVKAFVLSLFNHY